MTPTHLAHTPPTHCHNCGAAVDYNYCSVCGQETRLHVPSAGEFIHEFIGHYIAIEGRLWQTLYFLLFKPGFLTAEYIAGRRIRYVQPLRVYLTFSLIFFALLKLAGPTIAEHDAARERASVAASAHPSRAAVARASKSIDPDATIDLGWNPVLEARANAFMALPIEERDRLISGAFYAYVPYAMFCLMPLFAFYLKLLYLGAGRRYGEHLLFALHTNAFAFAVLGVLILFSSMNMGLLAFLAGLWMVCYLPLAMRRVYGGSRLATGVRWIVLVILHVASMALAIGTAFGWAILH